MFRKDIKGLTLWRIGGSNAFTLKDFFFWMRHEWRQNHSLYLAWMWNKANFKKMYTWYLECFKTLLKNIPKISK